MAKFYDEIPEWLVEWIKKQHMFWVASAPLSAHGHINLSPKGAAECFHVVNSKQVWYEDLSGSGIETISHLRENGRITVMFCALDGPPRISRLFGVGTVHEYGTPEYDALIPAMTRKPGSRAVIVVDVYQVGTSCGFAVPVYGFVTQRTQLLHYFDKSEAIDRSFASSQKQQQPSSCKDHDNCESEVAPVKGETVPQGSLRAYWLLNNTHSLDGLPGLLTAPDAILTATPQSHFDKDGLRPTLHRGDRLSGVSPNESGRLAFGDGKSLALGFALGIVTATAITRAFGKLQG
ncbi:hypothetical protein PAXRUDRAFT_827504 [Paxillus rubicundulus Ve08.2h10]|uniref:Pyridoxamine 5'-phosphate oxidase putative domain-containing protein n=1 Tax=Paxillus rubicundulus Ve08.2h10 TaxID=930991 RepID=A0A0D0E8H0_9AGAM|nr:hypothetical protein PAXRUDRAFT_827504 [Paxillus rubicundulus Ve08.2h10]